SRVQWMRHGAHAGAWDSDTLRYDVAIMAIGVLVFWTGLLWPPLVDNPLTVALADAVAWVAALPIVAWAVRAVIGIVAVGALAYGLFLAAVLVIASVTRVRWR